MWVGAVQILGASMDVLRVAAVWWILCRLDVGGFVGIPVG